MSLSLGLGFGLTMQRQATGGGVPTIPAPASLLMRHSAKDLADFTFSSGTLVSNWVDASGNGRDATQTTAEIRQPTRDAAALGGQGAVVFSEAVSARYLDLPTVTGISGADNRLWVGLVNFSDVSSEPVFSLGQAASGDGLRWTCLATGGFARVSIEGSGYTSSLALSTGTWHIIGAELDGTTLGDTTLYVDGASEAATGADVINTASGAFIGGDGRVSNTANMALAESLLYPGGVTTFADVRSYLRAEWGI